MLVKIILIIIAAICKAIVDTLSHHPRTSKLRGKFWNIKEGKIIPFTKYRWNGWHIVNSIMICCFIALPFIDLFSIYEWYKVVGAYILTGVVVFILPFNLFYYKILQYKEPRET